MEESRRLTYRPDIVADILAAREEVIAAVGTPSTATNALQGWAMRAREHAVKIRAVRTNLPNRRGLRIPEKREPEAGVIGRELNVVCKAGEGNQFSNVTAVRISHVELRSFGKSELATAWRPHSRVADDVS